MAIDRITPEFAYGIGDNLLQIPPLPIISVRAPGTRDLAQLGTTWVDTSAQSVYVLAGISAMSANWVTSPASGVGVFTSLTVNPGNATITAGDLTVTAGNFAISAGNATIGGDLTVGGTLSFTGDLDLTSAALIDLTSSLNAAPSIYLHANGGTLEQIRLHADQGTSVNSIELDSDVGGITLVSGLASADAINLSATSGGLDLDGVLQVNIASSQAAADAIRIIASDAAGGIDIDAGTGGIALDTTGAYSLDGAAASNVSVSGAGIDLSLESAAGRVVMNGEEAAADALRLLSAAGGLDADVALQMNLVSSQVAADAIVIEASDAAGGLALRAGSAGILIGNEADTAIIDIGNTAPTANRTITIAGGQNVSAGVSDLVEIGPDGVNNATANRTVDLNGGNLTDGALITYIARGNRAAGTHTVNISTGTGTKTVNLGNADGLTTFNLDAITLINDSLNVNTSINTGTSTGAVAIGNAAAGAITLDSAAGISLDAAAASNISVAGAGIDLSLISAAGRVIVNGEEAAANAVTILSAAGGIDADAALQINIDSSQAAVADSIRIVASAADGGIDIDAGTGGITIDTTGALSLQGGAASDVSTTGAGIDLTLSSAAGRVVVDGGEAAADALRLVASDVAGGIDIDSGTGGIALDSTGAFSIDGATASNITVTGASQDLTLSSVGGSVNISADEAAADAIVINASNAAGGIDLLTGGGELTINASGNVAMTPVSATVASPTSTAVTNGRVFKATFQGFTTAAAGTQAYTITNSALGAGDAIILTLANRGSNDAQITVNRVNTETAGTIIVNTTNEGAAALNGDVIITGWILD